MGPCNCMVTPLHSSCCIHSRLVNHWVTITIFTSHVLQWNVQRHTYDSIYIGARLLIPLALCGNWSVQSAPPPPFMFKCMWAVWAYLPIRWTTQSCWHRGQRLFCFTHSDMQQLWNEWLHSPQTTKRKKGRERQLVNITIIDSYCQIHKNRKCLIL